jgi:hypothetical protein
MKQFSDSGLPSRRGLFGIRKRQDVAAGVRQRRNAFAIWQPDRDVKEL